MRTKTAYILMGSLIFIALSLPGWDLLLCRIAPMFFAAATGRLAVTNISASRTVLGYSQEGRAIEGYVFGFGDDVIFLHGSIHGNEPETADLLDRLAKKLEMNPELIATTTKLVIIPITNPDGYYGREDKLNANGVNLNLNFPTSDWQQYGPVGTYAGPRPFSEAESRVIRKIVEQYEPKMMIAFHSQGKLVSPEDNEASIALAKWYAGRTGYRYFADWDYPGTATKWFVETTGKPAITVELSGNSRDNWNINKNALLELVSKPWEKNGL